MRRIRILSKELDHFINNHYKGKTNVDLFFERVTDKEKLSTIRKGGYCNSPILEKLFKKYGIE